MFIDRITVQLSAGKGGNGIVAWRRAKYIPKGGPAGGNGGQGGSVILQADTQLFCLGWYRHRKLLKAENGQQGGPNQQQGRKGKDLILKVPLGTLVKDPASGQVLHDFTTDKEKWEICTGGKGGRGNHGFRTPTNRAPNYCTPGKPGEEKTVELELKLIADIGFVGFPNAGKSTLINALADVKVKIAPYPFTTLRPNIGFLKKDDHSRIFIADIPGIIENAHQNRGLGLEFLRHIERTKLLFFVLDASGIDGRSPCSDYEVLRNELSSYKASLLNFPFFVILNKVDTEESQEHLKAFFAKYPELEECAFPISALSGEGIEHLAEQIRSSSLFS